MPAMPEPITATSHSRSPCSGALSGATSTSIQSDLLRRSNDFSIENSLGGGRMTEGAGPTADRGAWFQRCPGSSRRQQGLQVERVGGRRAFLVVVKIDHHVAALLFPGPD